MLHRGHPVRTVLDQAALGRMPTKAQLDAFGQRDDLAEGADLGRFRTRTARAARELVELYNADGGVRRSRARSWELASELADAMTDDERAADGDPPHLTEPIEDIGRRMFAF